MRCEGYQWSVFSFQETDNRQQETDNRKQFFYYGGILDDIRTWC
jgi:hypothetical protein